MRRKGYPDNYRAKFNYFNIPISYITKRIDRIRFTIICNSGTLRMVKVMLNKAFIFEKSYKPDKDKLKTVYQYQTKNIPGCHCSTLQLVTNLNSHYFLIDLQDPNKINQSLLRDILHCIDSAVVKISQIESALDLYPQKNSDLNDLHRSLSKNIYLRYSRKKSYSQKKSPSEEGLYTHYQGKGGNIRTGSTGLRIYQKPFSTKKNPDVMPEFVRVELQLNRPAIKAKNIELESLPIDFDLIGIFEYMDFRQGMQEKGLENLTATIFRKQYSKNQSRSQLWKVVRRKYVQEEIIEKVLLPKGKRAWDWFSEDDSQPVAGQIDGWKLLKNKYKFTQPIDSYFPKIDSDKIILSSEQ